ncbi:MAG TPA: ABC transporter permease [Anaerolineaceae bacterium]|nr:ABC transporter permease [Anaerolineaceae bacterium]
MNFSEVLGLALKSITSNKSRSFLTMLGVIIGVASVIVMIAVSNGTETQIANQINALGTNLLFISSSITRGGPNETAAQRQATGLVYTDVAAIKSQINGVAGVSVEQDASETLTFGSNTLTSIPVIGTTPDYTTVRGVQVATGRFITQQDLDLTQKVVVLGSDVATELFGSSNPIGQLITVNSTQLTVVGVLQEKGVVSGTNFNDQIYAPIQVVFQKFTPSFFARVMGDRVRTIYVSVDPKANMNDVITQISLLLAQRHKVDISSPDFTIQTQSDIIGAQESTTASFRTLLASVAGISLLVGGIGIMNIMLVSVTERTREIGLRQAVGATPNDIEIQFLTEAVMLSVVGGVIGILAGVIGSFLFGKFGGMPTVIASYSIGLSFGSSALVGILFGYIPARQAAQLDPIEALRHD